MLCKLPAVPISVNCNVRIEYCEMYKICKPTTCIVYNDNDNDNTFIEHKYSLRNEYIHHNLLTIKYYVMLLCMDLDTNNADK